MTDHEATIAILRAEIASLQERIRELEGALAEADRKVAKFEAAYAQIKWHDSTRNARAALKGTKPYGKNG